MSANATSARRCSAAGTVGDRVAAQHRLEHVGFEHETQARDEIRIQQRECHVGVLRGSSRWLGVHTRGSTDLLVAARHSQWLARSSRVWGAREIVRRRMCGGVVGGGVPIGVDDRVFRFIRDLRSRENVPPSVGGRAGFATGGQPAPRDHFGERPSLAPVGVQSPRRRARTCSRLSERVGDLRRVVRQRSLQGLYGGVVTVCIRRRSSTSLDTRDSILAIVSAFTARERSSAAENSARIASRPPPPCAFDYRTFSWGLPQPRSRHDPPHTQVLASNGNTPPASGAPFTGGRVDRISKRSTPNGRR